MEKLRFRLTVLALVVAALALSCGAGQGQSQLQSIALSPATADAQAYPDGQVQFTATGSYRNPSHTVTPLSATWGACQENAPTDSRYPSPKEASLNVRAERPALTRSLPPTLLAPLALIVVPRPTPAAEDAPIVGTAQLTAPSGKPIRVVRRMREHCPKSHGRDKPVFTSWEWLASVNGRYRDFETVLCSLADGATIPNPLEPEESSHGCRSALIPAFLPKCHCGESRWFAGCIRKVPIAAGTDPD